MSVIADNVAITAGAGTTIASDDVGGVQFQRVKITHGADGTASDANATTPLPVYGPDATTSATITTTDIVVGAPAGAGAFVTGASTSGSLVAVACTGGDSAWNMQITALTSGTLYFEGSLDSTNGTDGNWINVNGRQTGVVNTVLSGNATANGMYRGNTSGLKWIRVRSVGALTGTPAVRIHVSDGVGAMFLNASIPAGTNTIGAVKAVTSATGTCSSASLSLTSFTVLASNTARLGATFFNESAYPVYLGLTATTSVTAYTVQLPSGGYYELPYNGGVFTGLVSGIALTASGSVRVTELT